MGFLSNLVSATVKTALTPVAIVADTVKVASGKEANTTKNLIESAVDDAKEATEDIGDLNP